MLINIDLTIIFSTFEVHPSDALLLSKLRNFGGGSVPRVM